MYIVTETEGLQWVPENEPAKSGWDAITLQLRFMTLVNRTSILCNPHPHWFGEDYPTRTQPAVLSAWNVLVEFMHLDLLEKGYFILVSPTNERGIKFEFVGLMDIVNVICQDNGDISWRVYREIPSENGRKRKASATRNTDDEIYLDAQEGERYIKVAENCKRIANGVIAATEREDHPRASRTLRSHLKTQLLAFRDNN